MKSKKKFIFLLMIPLVFFLTSCGSSNKRALLNYLDKVSHLNKSQTNFKMKVTKFDVKDSDTDKATLNVIKTLIKDGSIESNYYWNGSQIRLDSKLKAVGETIPVELLADDKKLYLKGDGLQSVYNAVKDFDSSMSDYDFSILVGKYIDVYSIGKASDTLTDKQVKEYQKTQKDLIKAPNKSFSTLKNSIKSLPESSVTKKDDVITAVFHKSDIVSLLENIIKENDQNKGIEKKDIDEFKKEFKKFDLTIKFNRKKEILSEVIHMKTKDDDELEFQIELKTEKLKDEIKMPAKNKIIDAENFIKELQQLYGDDDDDDDI